MRIGVCIKQVPDSDANLRTDDSGRRLDESRLNWVISSCDICALEEALLLAEAAVAGGEERPEVVVFSLGPARVEEALRKALALGADRAVHLADDAFAGGDAVADGLALAAAVAREDCDLVLAGAQSDDLGQAATPIVMAAHLNCGHAWLVTAFAREEGSRRVRVVRELEAGMNEIVALDLPCVLAVQAGINKPRFASLRGTLQARRKPLLRVDAAAVGLEAHTVGAAGAGAETTAVRVPPASGGGVIVKAPSAEAAAAELIACLEREGVI